MNTQRISQAPEALSTDGIDLDLPARLGALATRIQPYDQDAGNRLTWIASQLPNPQDPRKSFDHIINLSPYEAINTDAIERRVMEHPPSFPRGYGVLETARNVLVLAPILVTWIALSIASHNYAETIAKHPEKSSEPFLLLWEKGFPEGLPFLSFSMVALLDFAILAVIILLTWYFHSQTDGHAQRDQNRRNELARQATDLRQELDEVMWRLAKVLSHRRLLRAPDQGALEAADRMKSAALVLETTANALSANVESAANRAETLAKSQLAFAQQQENLRKQFEALTNEQKQIVSQVSTSVQKLETAAQGMQASTQSVSGQLKEAVVAAKEAVAETTKGLALAQSAVGEASKAATAVTAVEQKLGDVVNQMNAVTGTLAQTGQSLDANANEARKLNDGINQVTQNLTGIATNIGAIPGNLQGISSSLQMSAQRTEATATATAGLLAPLQNLVGQLPTVSQGMQTVANNLGQTSQEMARSVAESKNVNQSLHQIVQTLPQGVAQMSQNFSQNIMQPMMVQVRSVEQQLNYVQQSMQHMAGIGQSQTSFWMRATRWFVILLLAAFLLPAIALIPWFIMQTVWINVAGLFISVIVLSALLATAISWRG